MILQNGTKDLVTIIRELGGSFYIVTTKETLKTDEAISFVEKAREKRMNDFNIANLIKTGNGFISVYLRK